MNSGTCRLAFAVGTLLSGLSQVTHGAASAPAGTAPTLNEVNEALSRAKTVFTHFVQERHLSLFKEPLRSEGYLCFEQPGRIRWEITEPYKSILVSDGSGVAQFEWVDEQWKKIDLGLTAAMQNVVSQIAGVMKGQYAQGGKEYAVELANTETGPLITLVPRNEKMRKMMKAIEVHLAPDLKATRGVVLRETTGDYTDIRFDQQAINTRFQEGTFDRRAPTSLEKVKELASRERWDDR
jgi:outer membrane lipoprotein-sorting protein